MANMRDAQLATVMYLETQPGPPEDTDLPRMRTITSSTSLLADPQYESLPLTYRIGLPLKHYAWTNESDVHPWMETSSNDYNTGLLCLSLHLDPKSPMFGRPVSKYRGDELVLRADGKDLRWEQLVPLILFVKKELKALFRYGWAFVKADAPEDELVQMKAAAEEEVEEKLTPQYYTEFFKAHMAKRREAGDDTLGDIECPVKLSCELCSERLDEGGKTRTACGMCKAVWYCDARCQGPDRVVHQ